MATEGVAVGSDVAVGSGVVVIWMIGGVLVAVDSVPVGVKCAAAVTTVLSSAAGPNNTPKVSRIASRAIAPTNARRFILLLTHTGCAV